jgi:hypothetical protein
MLELSSFSHASRQGMSTFPDVSRVVIDDGRGSKPVV